MNTKQGQISNDVRHPPRPREHKGENHGGKSRVDILFGFYGAIFYMLLALNAHSDSLTNTPGDLVASFKLAISSPPDVERYIVSQRQLESETFAIGQTIKSGLISYYIGARAGSNYFLQILSGSNGLPDLSQKQLIAGRSGAGAYEVNQNAVSFGVGSNGLAGNIGAFYTLTRQFLGMGFSEIEPESVRWGGNTFTATNNHGLAIYGELSISNGLPCRLGVSVAKGSPPYKMVEYTYPNLSPSPSGFPSKMIISRAPHGMPKPFCEVTFYSVQLAERPLPEDFFAVAQFAGPNIIYTNIYSNADLYVQNSRGQTVKAPDSIRKSGGYTNSRPRVLVLLCFALATIIPITFLILLRKKQAN